MTLEEFFNEIESISFAVRYSVASGFRTVKNGLEIDETLIALIEEIQSSTTNRKTLLDRLLTVLKSYPNTEHMNRYDEALVAYLYVLSRTDEQLTQTAVEQILQTNHLFWARRLAEELKQTAVEKTGTD
jgi:hypothetical protein